MDHLFYEKDYFALGQYLICGVDEVGRGPLAGPVMAGAVIPDFRKIIDGINDSKLLTDKFRRKLYPEICENAVSYKTALIEPDKIDEINILNATKLAMKKAIAALSPKPEVLFVDALKLELGIPEQAIVHGDALSYTIGMASILAKVERDDIMIKYAEIYPEYGFENNKGYGTKHHIEMLKKYGPCPIHRKTFIRKIMDGRL
ncbi:MAG: ribonuclease HII [Clostridia bacterium]|nr:ribonuclease HII [Clostridia bacterium]